MRVEVTRQGQSPEILLAEIYARAYRIFIFLSNFNVPVRRADLIYSQHFSHDTPDSVQRYARPANHLILSWFRHWGGGNGGTETPPFQCIVSQK